jgi:hypothetical protein
MMEELWLWHRAELLRYLHEKRSMMGGGASVVCHSNIEVVDRERVFKQDYMNFASLERGVAHSVSSISD